MRCYSCRKYDDCERPWKCDGTMYDCTAYELEQTNEEWFTSLSTEEKAKRIINIAVNSDCDYRTIVKWLKEKHE